MAVRRFINTSDGHNKFWEVDVVQDGAAFRLVRRWGKIGTMGQDSKITYPSLNMARTEMARLIEQKRERGYREEHPADSRNKGIITDHPFRPRPENPSEPVIRPWPCLVCGHPARMHSHADYGDPPEIKRAPQAKHLAIGTCLRVDYGHTGLHKQHASCVSWMEGSVRSVEKPEEPKPMSLEDIRAKFRVKHELV